MLSRKEIKNLAICFTEQETKESLGKFLNKRGTRLSKVDFKTLCVEIEMIDLYNFIDECDSSYE